MLQENMYSSTDLELGLLTTSRSQLSKSSYVATTDQPMMLKQQQGFEAEVDVSDVETSSGTTLLMSDDFGVDRSTKEKRQRSPRKKSHSPLRDRSRLPVKKLRDIISESDITETSEGVENSSELSSPHHIKLKKRQKPQNKATFMRSPGRECNRHYGKHHHEVLSSKMSSLVRHAQHESAPACGLPPKSKAKKADKTKYEYSVEPAPACGLPPKSKAKADKMKYEYSVETDQNITTSFSTDSSLYTDDVGTSTEVTSTTIAQEKPASPAYGKANMKKEKSPMESSTTVMERVSSSTTETPSTTMETTSSRSMGKWVTKDTKKEECEVPKSEKQITGPTTTTGVTMTSSSGGELDSILSKFFYRIKREALANNVEAANEVEKAFLQEASTTKYTQNDIMRAKQKMLDDFEMDVSKLFVEVDAIHDFTSLLADLEQVVTYDCYDAQEGEVPGIPPSCSLTLDTMSKMASQVSNHLQNL